jgi:hypothetical protein
MDIQLKYNSDTHNISLPLDASVKILQNEVFRLLAVPPERQKLIFRGHPIEQQESSLSDLKIAPGAKLLLVASGTAVVPKKPIAAPKSTLFPGHPFVPVFHKLADSAITLNQAVIDEGMPEGVMLSFSAQTDSLPSKPFVIRNESGVGMLSVETDAVFVQFVEGNKSERIFFSDVKACGAKSINKGEYFMWVLEDKQGVKYTFYWLPNQYRQVLVKLIQNADRS